MKIALSVTLCLSLIIVGACNAVATKGKVKRQTYEEGQTSKLPPPINLTDTTGQTIETRFNTPVGFKRTQIESNTFAAYLRNLKLKPDGSKVLYYDGTVKENYDVYAAVVDLPIGKRDLHQCADAIMRLRADYLRSQKRYDDIHFQFNNGFEAKYSKWMDGYRIHFNGTDFYWTKDSSPSKSDKSYWKYLEYVFSFAGTYSLAKELPAIDEKEMKIGDLFILGGHPGHGVIVIDMAVNEETGEKLFMLAQSYMPAQDIQILINPTNSEISPWYSLDFGVELLTPEWRFQKGSLKRF
jgi:hypothetical protein